MCVIRGLTQSAANDYCNMSPGVKSAYFFDKANITDIDFDATDRDITVITTASAGSLKAVFFDNDNAVISSELVGGYGTKQTQTLTIENVGLSATLRNTIAEWTKCTCLGVIAVLENGQRVMLGLEFDSTSASDEYSFRPKKNAGSYNSGTALDTDKTNKTITTFTFENMGNAPVLLSSTCDLTGL